MALTRNTYALLDNQGNSLANTDVTVEIRREVPGQPLDAVPYADDDATVPLGNPFVVNTGEIAVHLIGGRYRIRAYIGDPLAPTFERIWRYQNFGLGGATDTPGLSPAGEWDVATSYNIGFFVTYNNRNFASNSDNNVGNTPPSTATSDANWTYLVALQGPTGAPGSSDVVGTSTTSLSPAPGANALTVLESDRGWGVGARLRATSNADPANDWFEGFVSAYAGNALTIDADRISPDISAGPFAAWTINLIGDPGQDGAAAADYKGTSTTSLPIGTGTKEFFTQAGKQFEAGQFILATSGANPTVNYMHGQVTSYSSTTLTIDVGHVGGAGTHADWSLSISGPSITGQTGPAGPATVVDVSFRAASTGNTTLSGTQTLDGVALADGDDYLAKDQAAPAENGPYIVRAGAWERHPDYDTWDEIVQMGPVKIEEGSQAGNIYVADAQAGGTLGVTAINFSQRYGSATESVEGLGRPANDAEADGTTEDLAWLTPHKASERYSRRSQGINFQTGTAYTLVLDDADKLVYVTNAGAITLTVPPNSSVAFPDGTHIDVFQGGAGQITLAEGSGVSILSKDSNKKLVGLYSAATLVKTSTNTWILVGDLAA